MRMNILPFIVVFFFFTKLEDITPVKEVSIVTAEKVLPVISKEESEIREVLEKENLDPYIIELLVAQSKHESGNYKNGLTRYNNVFARHYHKTDSFAISAGAKAEGHSRFAIYPSIKYATLSQVSYLKRKNYSFNWKSPREFAIELKEKKYYEASIKEYASALKKYMVKV